MKKLKIAVLMGGKSPEYEVSLASGREVVRYLNPQKYEVLPVVISQDGKKWQVVDKKKLLHSPAGVEEKPSSKFILKNSKLIIAQNQNLLIDRGVGKVDLVFIAMHGPYWTKLSSIP